MNNATAKRVMDILLTLLVMLLALPLMGAIALWVRMDSAGPALFRQQRVGLGGRLFEIHKFRTMYAGSEAQGLAITADNDPRITRVGHWLRKTKLDELPQLFDVLKGEMSLVGPRPEVPQWMALYAPSVRAQILSVRPGMTDRAAIEFREESSLLRSCDDPERVYREQIMPRKQRYYLDYVAHHSVCDDLRILRDTVKALWI